MCAAHVLSWLSCSLCVHSHICGLSQLMQDDRGETALFAASQEGHLETATLLLKSGALVNYKSKVRPLYVHGQRGRMVCSF